MAEIYNDVFSYFDTAHEIGQCDRLIDGQNCRSIVIDRLGSIGYSVELPINRLHI